MEHTGPLPHWINIPSSSSAANQHTCCYIPLKEKKEKDTWEVVSFLSFYFPISLPGKISIEFHLCDAFYRPLATVWCKMDKLIKGIGWQTHKTYLYTLEPTHKDLLPSSSFESPPSKEVTFLAWGHISRHFKVRRAFLRHRKWNDWEYRDRKCRQDKTWKLFSPVWKALFSTSYKLHNMLIGIWARSHITRWTAVPKYTIDHRRSSTNQHPCFYRSDLYYFHRFYVRTIITFRYYVELKLFYFVLWSVCREGEETSLMSTGLRPGEGIFIFAFLS